MKIMIRYETLNGGIGCWTTTEERFDHICAVCEAKGLRVVGFDYVD